MLSVTHKSHNYHAYTTLLTY